MPISHITIDDLVNLKMLKKQDTSYADTVYVMSAALDMLDFGNVCLRYLMMDTLFPLFYPPLLYCAKAREREFALRKEEVAEARRQQEAFQQGFLSTLSQLVQVLDKRRDSQPVAPPLD